VAAFSHRKEGSGVRRLDREENARAEAFLAEHEGKVQALARKYLREGVELEDLVQVARLAVLRAGDKLDPAMGSGESYVWQSITFALMDYIRDTFSTIKVPRNKFGKVWMNCDPLDSPRFNDGETTLAERIAAEPAEELLDADEWELLDKALARLPERERAVIHARFFEGVTFREIGERRGCRTQNVQQIAAKALKRLRSMGRLKELHQRRAA
jgi:RNA polymerase sigma-B factor